MKGFLAGLAIWIGGAFVIGLCIGIVVAVSSQIIRLFSWGLV